MVGVTHPERTVTIEQPSIKTGKAVAGRTASDKPWSWFPPPHLTTLVTVFAALALLALALPLGAAAQTFTEASSDTLEEICANVLSGGVGPALVTICGSNVNPGGMVSVAPAAESPQDTAELVVEQRAQAFRESEERRRGASPTRVRPASYAGGQVFASEGQLDLPPTGGARPDIVISPAQGLSLFVSAGAFALNHHNNRFEDGYEAQLPTVTVGADYRVTARLLAGLAFNYTNFDGTYDDGGGFDKDIFSPVLYATFLPFERTFVSATLAYARNENSNDRKVVLPLSGGGTPATDHTSADYSENLYSAGLQAGYDHPLGDFTIGPRLGLSFAHSQVDSFEEKGDTGLELRYSGLDQTSLQSSLGLAATVAIDVPNGLLLPQASVAWVHEYANDARNVDARYVEAPSFQFTFQRERPARDWANIALGVSASFANGMQPFVQFVTVQGNENYVSYGGTAGLRYSF
jgi:uncharacterized protein YhjY with autotransporter beta-barrel domain